MGLFKFRKIILLLGDLICFEFALWLGLSARHWRLVSQSDFMRHLPLLSILFLIWIIVNYINNLYEIDQNPKNISFYRQIWEAAGIAFIVGIVYFYFAPIDNISPKTILLLNVVLGYGLVTIWRWLSFTSLLPNVPRKKILFVGKTKESQELNQILKNKYTNTYESKGIEQNIERLNEKIKENKIDVVVIAPHLKEKKEEKQKLFQLLFNNIEIKGLTSFYEKITGRVPPISFTESWFLEHLGERDKKIFYKIRRGIDLVVGCILGLITLILTPLIVLAIKLETKGPALIKQQRIGKDEDEFTMYKFRSMYALSEDGLAETDGVKFAKEDDSRITKVGKFLRQTRLDELPQTWNLLKGDLTLIGPRPERPEIVAQLKEEMSYYSLRHIVRPGLTSWALLHQNYTDTLEETLQKLQYDLFYIKNQSLLLDLSIGLKTINVLIKMMGQ